MFLWRNKKNIHNFWLKKNIVSFVDNIKSKYGVWTGFGLCCLWRSCEGGVGGRVVWRLVDDNSGIICLISP